MFEQNCTLAWFPSGSFFVWFPLKVQCWSNVLMACYKQIHWLVGSGHIAWDEFKVAWTWVTYPNSNEWDTDPAIFCWLCRQSFENGFLSFCLTSSLSVCSHVHLSIGHFLPGLSLSTRHIVHTDTRTQGIRIIPMLDWFTNCWRAKEGMLVHLFRGFGLPLGPSWHHGNVNTENRFEQLQLISF